MKTTVFENNSSKNETTHLLYGLNGFQTLPYVFPSENKYLKLNNTDNKHSFININLLKFRLSDEQEYCMQFTLLPSFHWGKRFWFVLLKIPAALHILKIFYSNYLIKHRLAHLFEINTFNFIFINKWHAHLIVMWIISSPIWFLPVYWQDYSVLHLRKILSIFGRLYAFPY